MPPNFGERIVVVYSKMFCFVLFDRSDMTAERILQL